MNDIASSSKVDFEQTICIREHESNENYEDCELSPGLLRLIEHENKKILPHQELIDIVNLGNEDDKREVQIGTFISPKTRDKLISLLQEFKDVFAWTYQDMPGLNTDIVMHELPLKPECKPVQ